MAKTNCWNFTNCGREPGGKHVDEFGVCPAAVEGRLDGINGGHNGGRACWAVSETFCEGNVQGNFRTKVAGCKRCDFYNLVQLEQGCKFRDTREIRRHYILGDVEKYLGQDYQEYLHIKVRPCRDRLAKLNCWEFMQCGREPEGVHAAQFGVCPAAVQTVFDGINEGRNGGRACWAICGTLCDGKVQGTFASKTGDCRQCKFYQLVQSEQVDKFESTRDIRRVYMLSNLQVQLGEEFREYFSLNNRSMS